ncbi:LANO_0D08614g1_1 [Lachancea nothofagi CBS 11611]|uniref:Glutamate--cysteine ligase n=1 Tax=Lachancea nothofagi CBS 11611 TaxID=1266666 RepID=A0A1G4JJ72_9SACH|nr:LANO_0D08614g1_1 [Lachancea nothofagi CBS 11611]
MGLLSLGTPLEWHESSQYSEHVRKNGIEQLLYVFRAANARKEDPLLWGDEVEYMICVIDDARRNAVLAIDDDEVLLELNTEDKGMCDAHNASFHPEYGRFMIEATPAEPYRGFVNQYVEENMAQRRALAEGKLRERGADLLSLAVFPRMGCPGFTDVPQVWSSHNAASRSLYLPDQVINRHARFPTLTANIRTRRGEKVCINVPMYQDEKTPKGDDTVVERDWFTPEDQEAVLASKPGHIYMDGMGFGMGSSCLQLTFQAPNVDKARYLYDSLVNFAPVLLAATAASPAFKGWLADQDVRWDVISASVDDRTPYERSEEPLLPKYNNGHGYTSKAHPQRIPKSRYSAVDLYLGGNPFFDRKYNDTNVPLNESALEKLQTNHLFPMDYDLARHFSHLFIRDPLVVFQERVDQDNQNSTDHFENIQSTNWQTLRFKPPTQAAIPGNNSTPGWRVEFRPMEIHVTDFENAAYSNFLFLIVECLLKFSNEINAYLPMSQVWQNMQTAHRRDAVVLEKFHWKKSFTNEATGEYSFAEIFQNSGFGIFPQFIDRILKHKNIVASSWTDLQNSSDAGQKRLYYYLKLVFDRATGVLPTTANFLREYITHHPSYQKDSRLSSEINYDLLKMMSRITHLDDSKGELSKFLGKEIADFLANRI